jgi:hypothetical protein
MSITGINPSSGPVTGQTPVTISGHNFIPWAGDASSATSQMQVDMENLPCKQVQVVDNDTISCVTSPGQAAGTFAVTVANGAETVTLPAIVDQVTGQPRSGFTYTVYLSLTNEKLVEVGLIPTLGGVVSSSPATYTTATNSPNGYTMTIQARQVNLVSTIATDVIAGAAGTLTTPALLDDNSWGFAIAKDNDNLCLGKGCGNNFVDNYAPEANELTSQSLWAGLPTTAATIKKTAGPAYSGDNTTVYYGVKANLALNPNTYEQTVVVTVITNL